MYEVSEVWGQCVHSGVNLCTPVETEISFYALLLLYLTDKHSQFKMHKKTLEKVAERDGNCTKY